LRTGVRERKKWERVRNPRAISFLATNGKPSSTGKRIRGCASFTGGPGVGGIPGKAWKEREVGSSLKYEHYTGREVGQKGTTEALANSREKSRGARRGGSQWSMKRTGRSSEEKRQHRVSKLRGSLLERCKKKFHGVTRN